MIQVESISPWRVEFPAIYDDIEGARWTRSTFFFSDSFQNLSQFITADEGDSVSNTFLRWIQEFRVLCVMRMIHGMLDMMIIFSEPDTANL